MTQTYIDTIRITTDPVAVTISQVWNGTVQASVQIIDRDVARDFGTFILHCAGNPSLHTTEDYVIRDAGGNGWLHFAAGDGVPFLSVSVENSAASRVELPEDDAIDMGQRLIVWAGVK